MATAMYRCGCWFTHSMFGERELCGLGICMKHCKHRDVQCATVSDLQQVVLSLLDQEDCEL